MKAGGRVVNSPAIHLLGWSIRWGIPIYSYIKLRSACQHAICVWAIMYGRDISSQVATICNKTVSVQRNNERRSWNNCCSGKAVNITYSECVFAALGMRGTWYVGRASRIQGTLTDEWRRALVVGASLCEGFHEGDFERGLLYWGPRNMRFLRDMQNAL
jgi:hypothetical protein